MKTAMPTTELNIGEYMQALGSNARSAAAGLAKMQSSDKNNVLLAIADQIEKNQQIILEANANDMAYGRSIKLTAALLDRLELTPDRITAMAEGCRQIAQLPDPVGEMSDFSERPSGIKVGKMRVPLGVIGIIYESRPNVTIDAAALCFKSGNAAILRGGSEAFNSNMAIAQCVQRGLEAEGADSRCIQLIETTDRDAVGALISAEEFVDIIIPRGGKNLIERISADATVPVIKHLEGLCHIYIDDDADLNKAVDVAYNAKARRYGICGAMETLLVAASRAAEVLPPLATLYDDKGIELRVCERAQEILPNRKAATEQDWRTEYLDAVLSIRVVDNLDSAIAHIATYGSSHTDAIITENQNSAQQFLREVDSSSVMWNASTQFADGFEYGLGAEIGISTNKLHVRGPVGLEGLTTQKYVVIGDGTVRA